MITIIILIILATIAINAIFGDSGTKVEEKIVKEFLREIHSHHPRRTIKEAELILTKLFPEIKD